MRGLLMPSKKPKVNHMIETTYLRLSKAAEILGSDEDALLIAATENRVHLHRLFNRFVAAEQYFKRATLDPQSDESPDEQVSEGFSFLHFMYIPLSAQEAAGLLKSSSTIARPDVLSEPEGPDHTYWALASPDGDELDEFLDQLAGLTEDDFRVDRNHVFLKYADVEKIKALGAVISEQPPSNGAPIHVREHMSEKLVAMTEAAMRFWGKAERHDRGTHPDNATVASWLEKRGFSATLADKAATIIRPLWAPTGRKPEE